MAIGNVKGTSDSYESGQDNPTYTRGGFEETKKTAHSEVIEQLKVEKPKMETMNLQYETIVTTGQIPNVDPPQPTTSSLLRKKMVEDTTGFYSKVRLTPPNNLKLKYWKSRDTNTNIVEVYK